MFSASFTNVFLDSDLERVLDILDFMKPQYAVDISVVTSWEYCVGRLDPADFYKRIGMSKRASIFEVPLIGQGSGHRIWIPEKYWANRVTSGHL
jgi:hypothetical protein